MHRKRIYCIHESNQEGAKESRVEGNSFETPCPRSASKLHPAASWLLHPVAFFQSIPGLLKRWKSQILVAARGKGAGQQNQIAMTGGGSACGNCGRDIPSNNLVSHSVFCYRCWLTALNTEFNRMNMLCHRASNFSWSYCTPGTVVEILAEAITTDAQRVGMLLLFGTRLEVVWPRRMCLRKSNLEAPYTAERYPIPTSWAGMGSVAGKPYGSVD